MMTYLITVGLILALLLAGLAVNRLYQGFARRNPQLGPFRDPDARGCGSCSSSCSGGSGCSGEPCEKR